MKPHQTRQTRHYRQLIQQLSEENEKLREQMEQYSEKGFTELVNETVNVKKKYELLMKQAAECRGMYEKLLREQRKLNREYTVTR